MRRAHPLRPPRFRSRQATAPLVLEGILPFVSPGLAQKAFRLLSESATPQLRIVGLGSMLAGLALLYSLRG